MAVGSLIPRICLGGYMLNDLASFLSIVVFAIIVDVVLLFFFCNFVFLLLFVGG